MPDLQVAVLSDIHGNRWALEAVLEDIERRGISNIVNLGDSLYGPLDPGGTARILIELDIPTVRGNEDRILLEAPDESKDSRILDYVRSRLTSEHERWLESLNQTAVAFDCLFMVHGTPKRDDEYLLVEVTERGVFPRKKEELAAMLASIEQPVILCGHDHVPRTVQLPDGKLVVDPGSVGVAAYTDDQPFPHVMDAGSPHARYAVVGKTGSGWRIEHVALPY